LETRIASLQDVIERLAVGVALLDHTGVARTVNRAATVVLTRGDGLSLDRSGRPVVADPAARGRLDALIAATRLGGPGGVTVIKRQDSGSAYAVLVAPATPAIGSLLDLPTHGAGTILLIHDPLKGPRFRANLLRAVFGFTPGTAKLVAALLEDDNLKSYSERERISIHTARFYLRAALERTQTRTQVELVRVVMRTLSNLQLFDEGRGVSEPPDPS
jgi:hypothetical protein